MSYQNDSIRKWPRNWSHPHKQHLSCYPLQWTAQHLHCPETATHFSVVISSPEPKAHMTKMATTPLYGKNRSKIFFSGTDGPIFTKIGM